ncbi:MAG: DNA mismatch repair endonuclease MutL [Desulforhopalus sp.]
MSKIRILPEQLANQIAAGEVVERPASVVKELVENSLDAGATRVEVEVEGAGTRLIRIIDNGEGMDEDDLLMSIERHGTSKIATEEDLGAIGTLGFRGEAVPSIGSVSQLTLTSRPPDKDLGNRLVLKYGRLLQAHEVGCGFGTTVEVRNLFGNTPARRKFLRTARTELGHIEEVVKDYALGAPGVGFILRVNEKCTLDIDATQTVEQRLARIMRYNDAFIPVGTMPSPSTSRKVFGFLVPPETIASAPAKLRIFVNGRAVRDRMIVHGVMEGLRGFLMKGRSPSGLMHIVLPPDEVDVNVHPAKHEVRFRNGRDVHSLLVRTVSEAMHQYQQSVRVKIFGKDRSTDRTQIPVEKSVGANAHVPPPADYDEEEVTSFLFAHKHAGHDRNAEQSESVPAATSSEPSRPAEYSAPSQPLFITAEPIPQDLQTTEATTQPCHVGDKRTDTNRHRLLVIGQFDDLYIFCKSSEGLVVIDQHAAHERLLYEKFRGQYLAGAVVRQNLMFPETVELSVFQNQLVEKNRETIDRMGFTLREFGGNTYIISAVPALAGLASPGELFNDILEQFGSEHIKGDRGGALDAILARMACKAAVKAGTQLSAKEINKLLDDMAEADLFSHCPHGRPVVKHFTHAEIKKWFYRT